MRQQPVPAVTEADLARVIAREFPGDAGDKAAALLSAYGGESWHREPVRVKLAALKLANGDLGKLAQFVSAACTDYRDVLMWAEYPAYAATRAVYPPEREHYEAIERDWSEYSRWFSGK